VISTVLLKLKDCSRSRAVSTLYSGNISHTVQERDVVTTDH